MPLNPWDQVLQPMGGAGNGPPQPVGWQNPGAGLPAFSGMPPQAASYLNGLAARRRQQQPPAPAQGFQNFGAQGQLAGAGPAPPGGYSPAMYDNPNQRGQLNDETFAQRMNAGVRPQDLNLADIERYMFPNAPGMGVATEATPIPGVPMDLYLSNPGHYQQYHDVSPMHEALPMMMRLGQMATQNQQVNQQWQLGLGQLGVDTGRLGATVENQRAQNALGLGALQNARAELQLRQSPEARRGQADLMLAQGLANGTIQPQQLAYINSTMRGQNMFQPFGMPMPPLPNIPGVSGSPAPGPGGGSDPLTRALTTGPQLRGSADPRIGIQPDWNALRAAGINPAMGPSTPTAAQLARDAAGPIGAPGRGAPQGGQAQGTDLAGQLMGAWNQAAMSATGRPVQQGMPSAGDQMHAAITNYVLSPDVQRALASGNYNDVIDFLNRTIGAQHINSFARRNFSVIGRRTPHEEARDSLMSAQNRAAAAAGRPDLMIGSNYTLAGIPTPFTAGGTVPTSPLGPRGPFAPQGRQSNTEGVLDAIMRHL